MTKIQVLPSLVIHQIAAGEVAERPATIIKELLENALDAAATQIKVEVELGRQTKIIVSDNGSGMSADDLQLAPLRHTTSKITEFKDLETLATFGFRGEALAAMAFASRLTIMSRLATETGGYAVTVTNDQVSLPRPVGMACGTVVIIEDLFEHLPARHSFLKKPATELKIITEVITAAALSKPQVAFIFEYQHKRLLALPPNQDLISRSLELFRLTRADDLLEVNFGTTPLRLCGWIGKPHLASYTRQKQVWIINNRPVSQPELTQVVKNAYGSLLEPRAEPSFVLELELPPTSVDVNAHPQKSTLNFTQTDQVLQLIATALSRRLTEADLSYRLPSDFKPSTTHSTSTSYLTRQFASPGRKNISKHIQDFHASIAKSWQPGSVEKEIEIMQVERTYLLLETRDGFEVVDQHAAHERILFEDFSSTLARNPIALQPAILLHINNLEKQSFELHSQHLHTLGFEAENFGQDILKISKVPAILTHQNSAQITNLFLEMLHELVTINHSVAWEEQQRQVVASLACHSAVRAGDYLTLGQRRDLLKQLQQTPNSATCPHGRPTTIKISFKELAHLFKRA